jgi:hypothetical protein
MVRLDTICLIIALVAQGGWGIFQLDVIGAFMHGEFSDEVFVQ